MNSLAEDLLWLLLDDQSGQPLVDRISMSRVLAGAVLLEMTLTTPGSPMPPLRLATCGETGKPLCLIPTDTLTTTEDDPVSTTVADLMQGRAHTPKQAIERLQRPVHRVLLHRLCADGRVIAMTSWLLCLIPLRSWPTLDHPRKAALRQTLRDTLLDARLPDPHTTALIVLLNAVNALPPQFPGRNPHTITRSARQMTSGHYAWSIDAIHAAIHTSYTDSFTTFP
ncbi:GOLPH3/VPS74 family protein [Nocardia brevicatena]|uniref:GOLPH3/VPS74 family protein n=1 Tax=Nocardia brevicatena TaxID=37327 RepID=UPI0005943910|nr:GPP34 family phosphoprotein [Nocardia brevicatena]